MKHCGWLLLFAVGCVGGSNESATHDLAAGRDLVAAPDLRSPDLRDPTVPDLLSQNDLLPPPPDLFTGPVTVSKTHWRQTFVDDFRGKEGKESDSYCFDDLAPQCHIWPGASQNCDQTDTANEGPFPPTKANLVAAIKLIEPGHDFASMSLADVKLLYGELIKTRMAALNKCNWTLYQMVNWMATDYAGHWAARFDATQVEVVPQGKGYLLLSAERAPVETDCIYGGSLGGPNCQLYAFGSGELNTGVTYWVDPNPAAPGVYYAATGSSCPVGGTLSGPNCLVKSFAPHVLEETGVTYWVDTNPSWPGVYYANQTYRCKENIDYTPALGFRNLTCPILNGGLMSYEFTNRPFVDSNSVEHKRGTMQYQGRFEAKAMVPRGTGSFPATWLMPKEGGWPYKGGEIDVMEARDNANEVYQTYHHGKCYTPADGTPIDATDSADCATKSGKSTHLAKGFTSVERTVDEFWTRDHLFAAEWKDGRIDYYINNAHIGTIEVGTLGVIDNDAPAALANFEASNFPTSPFYWILNHSTYVPPDKIASFAKQTFRIDYVKNYVACGTDNAEYCPCGGRFHEGIGCSLDGDPLVCPSGVATPTVTGGIYQSPCQPSTRRCVNGGTPDVGRCIVHRFAPGQIESTIDYWVDADPKWPGVYYAKIGNACPYGGSGTVNCQIVGFPADVLETGVDYGIDKTANPPLVYYVQDFDY